MNYSNIREKLILFLKVVMEWKRLVNILQANSVEMATDVKEEVW